MQAVLVFPARGRPVPRPPEGVETPTHEHLATRDEGDAPRALAHACCGATRANERGTFPRQLALDRDSPGDHLTTAEDDPGPLRAAGRASNLAQLREGNAGAGDDGLEHGERPSSAAATGGAFAPVGRGLHGRDRSSALERRAHSPSPRRAHGHDRPTARLPWIEGQHRPDPDDGEGAPRRRDIRAPRVRSVHAQGLRSKLQVRPRREKTLPIRPGTLGLRAANAPLGETKTAGAMSRRRARSTPSRAHGRSCFTTPTGLC